MADEFKERFEKHLREGNYSKWVLPDKDTYNLIIALLSKDAPLNRRFYYVKERFEFISVGGMKKLIKLRKNSDEAVQYLLKATEICDVLMDAHVSTGHGGEKTLSLNMAEAAVEEVFRLFHQYGDSNYLGEAVSKTQHSLQCGMLALKEGASLQVVVGAFLHDIGHLVGIDRGLSAMVTEGKNLGAAHHDKLGGDYLQGLGFPPTVCALVAGHVQAKRYRVWKDQGYYEALSSASKMTLEHQGGGMTDEEAHNFEASPLFEEILHMRGWDEQAKDPNIAVESLEAFRPLCLQVLQEAPH